MTVCRWCGLVVLLWLPFFSCVPYRVRVDQEIAYRHGFYPTERVPQYERTDNERCYSHVCWSYDLQTGKTSCEPELNQVRCWHQLPPDKWQETYTPDNQHQHEPQTERKPR